MPELSGTTEQTLARLLEQEATHTLIESLYHRFEVPPLPTDTNPNKLRKTTYLVKELARRRSGRNTLMGLINYLGSDSAAMPAFRRGSVKSEEFYKSLDQDLESKAKSAPNPPSESTPQQAGEHSFQRPASSTEAPSSAAPEKRRYVFVVRGRDQSIYASVVAFLKALDLRVISWDEASERAGGGSPHTLDIVRAGIEMANGVIVLMTPDDQGKVKPEFSYSSDDPREASLSGQARQNVIFEAGWAMALNQGAVILVRVGDVRQLTDIAGLNYVSLTNDISSRKQLISRLRSSGLEPDPQGEEWRTAGIFPEYV